MRVAGEENLAFVCQFSNDLLEKAGSSLSGMFLAD